MMISVIIPSFYPATVYGGPIFTSLYTCEELAKQDVMVSVSTTNANKAERLDVQPNVWKKRNNNFYIKYYDETVIGKFSFSLLLNVWKDIKKADVIHIQGLFSLPVPIALIYVALFGKRALLTPHGTLGQWCLSGGSRFKSIWLKCLIKPFISTTIWHATADMEKMEILSVFPEVRVKVIPNGVNINEFHMPNILDRMQYTQKFAKKTLNTEKILVSIGRIHKIKGFDILINAFVDVLRNHPECKLFIAGPDDGEKANLEQQRTKLGLQDKAFLVDSIAGQDKVDFLANADLFILPSYNENFGVVYIESLAAGTPIVASKNTPWAEVEEADCGRWVDNSVDETADAIIEMLQIDREMMRINSRKFAEKYDWKNIAVQFKEVFKEMLDE